SRADRFAVERRVDRVTARRAEAREQEGTGHEEWSDESSHGHLSHWLTIGNTLDAPSPAFPPMAGRQPLRPHTPRRPHNPVQPHRPGAPCAPSLTAFRGDRCFQEPCHGETPEIAAAPSWRAREP